jgi:prepilin-type N-terminal cleavage/methylation domain-containing protein
MKSYKHKTGVTLIEILIVVAVIAILVSMVIGIAARIDSQGKEQLIKNTFALLDTALSQFGDYGYRYSDPCDADLKFPLDCNDFSKSDLENALRDALGLGAGSVTIGGSGTHEPNYSGSEALYFFLSRVPDCRETLDKIDKSLITDKGSNGQSMSIDVGGKVYPLLRFIDPWGKTLRYSYYRNNRESIPSREPELASSRTFPVIISAGPDKEFGTADDIASR